MWLESLGDFAEHAQEIDAKRVYLSISNQGASGQLVPSSEGNFSILATARTTRTILQFQETVRAVSHIDAFVSRDDAEKAIAARMAEITGELEAAGFTVKQGKWTL
ncbi:MAG: hypothetical protein KY445_00905 [Armatimonadetes bacterium]|nr:hypothetical protein [Armatimonadota bacterium]